MATQTTEILNNVYYFKRSSRPSTFGIGERSHSRHQVRQKLIGTKGNEMISAVEQHKILMRRNYLFEILFSRPACHLLALQLLSLWTSESMGNHDSNVMGGANSVD